MQVFCFFGVENKKLMKNVSTLPFMWSPQWESEYNSKTNSIKATKKSLCCPSKYIVAFKHCLLIKTQQKRITRCSACNESRRTTPIKASIHMKAISRQQQLLKSSPPCQPPFAPQQECGRVCVYVWDLPLCHWRGQLGLGASHCFTRMPAPLPVPSRSPGSARLYVCQAEEPPSGTLLSSFLLG